MPEWRRLYRNVSESKKLPKLNSDSPRLLWTWMIPFTDCEGRVIADPVFIKNRILPRFEDWTVVKIKKCLKDLDEIKMIQLYEIDGEMFAQFEQPNFEDFQKPRRDKEASSRIPAPLIRGKSRPTPELAGQTPDQLQSLPGKVHTRIEERRGEESRLEESRLKEKREEKEGPEGFKKPPAPALTPFFSFEKLEWEGITKEFQELLNDTFPACNIEHELKKMKAWLITHPEKRKKNYKSFIYRWLNKTQDEGGSKIRSFPNDKPKWIDEKTKELKEKGDI